VINNLALDIILEFLSVKSHGLMAWLLAFKTSGRAKSQKKPSFWPGLAWPIWAKHITRSIWQI
jgi:hypothetical protein